MERREAVHVVGSPEAIPTHFEPLESPVRNALYPAHQFNPPTDKKERPDNPYASSPHDPRCPFVLTTYRLTEHHTAGGMSRALSHLSELQPELFAEISPEVAQLTGVSPNEWVTIVTPRALISARALITPRMIAINVEAGEFTRSASPARTYPD
jgi:formate dehydrogenase major subunit